MAITIYLAIIFLNINGLAWIPKAHPWLSSSAESSSISSAVSRWNSYINNFMADETCQHLAIISSKDSPSFWGQPSLVELPISSSLSMISKSPWLLMGKEGIHSGMINNKYYEMTSHLWYSQYWPGLSFSPTTPHCFYTLLLLIHTHKSFSFWGSLSHYPIPVIAAQTT